PKKDVHNRQTLPAGTEIPNELTKGDAKDSDVDHGFQRTPTAKKDNELKQLEDGSFSLGDDWDLGDLGEDEGDAPAAATPRPQRTENSTIRYVADPSLRGAQRDEFPWNVSSSDLVRAVVLLLIKK